MTNLELPPPATQGPRRWPRSWNPGIFHAKKETIEPLEVPATKRKFALLLTQVGIYACLFAPIQLLIGLQASMIARDQKEIVLSVVTGCGKTEEFHLEGLEDTLLDLGSNRGYTSIEHTVELTGLCEECGGETSQL